MHNTLNSSSTKRQLRFRGDVSAGTNRIEELQNEDIQKIPKDDVGVTTTTATTGAAAAQQRLHNGESYK